jgi:hypothetical protein
MKKFFSLVVIAVLSFSFQRDATLDAPKVAICIIGSDSTPDYTSMNGIVTLLQQNGYSVYKFYDPNNRKELNAWLPMLRLSFIADMVQNWA